MPAEGEGEYVELCLICGGEIRVQIFKGLGVCCENCDKKRKGIEKEERALAP